MPEEVTATDGGRWLVRRRWIPYRGGIGLRVRLRLRRLTRADKEVIGTFEPPLFDGLANLGLGLLLVAAIVVILLFGWPLVLVLLDLVWLLLVLTLGLLGRVLLRRPWRVEALGPRAVRHEWRVVGFRAAGRQRDDVVRRLQGGLPLEGGERFSSDWE
jgi:hypothetical protein